MNDDKFFMENIYWILPLAAILLFSQAMWIFQDARKRGEKYYWLWGLYGLLQVPSSLIVYLVVTRCFRNADKRQQCPICSSKQESGSNYCRDCGEKLKEE